MNDLPKEAIYQLADSLMESAKKGLATEGAVFPVCYVLCSKMEVGPYLRKMLMDGESGKNGH